MRVATDVRLGLLFISSLFLTAFFAAATETKWFVFRTDQFSVTCDSPCNHVIAAGAVSHKRTLLVKVAFASVGADSVNVRIHAASLMLHRYGFLFCF
jgi:hypothetical protein